MKTETYLLPDFWASALINDDETGLSDDERADLISWVTKFKPGVCIGCDDAMPEFTEWHDAQGYALACDCLTYTFHQETAE